MAEGGQPNWSEMNLSLIPEGLRSYLDVPAKVLVHSRRVELAMWLNPPRSDISEIGLLKDWRGLAEWLAFSPLEIDNLALDNSPTVLLLGQWMNKTSSKLESLLEALCAMERFDILRDVTLMARIEKDVQNYLRREAELANADSNNTIDPFQDAEVQSSDDMEVMEFTNITINETPGHPEFFDAFISYASTDFEFVNQMINKLEGQHGLKLCVPNRDLVGGCAKYTIMAKLIKDRCTKMIIILSPDFMKSKACDFQAKFAHSLTPGAKEKKLIPIVYKSCQIPNILNHICLLDYTRCDVVDWFWNRLANSLKPNQTSRTPAGRRSTSNTAHTAPVVGSSIPPTTRGQAPPRQAYTAPIKTTDGGQLVETELVTIPAPAAALANDSMQTDTNQLGQRSTQRMTTFTTEPRRAESSGIFRNVFFRKQSPP